MPRAVISKARNSDLRSPSRPPRMLSLPTVRAGGCTDAAGQGVRAPSPGLGSSPESGAGGSGRRCPGWALPARAD